MSGLPVHPVADLFPMLADDELAGLAEDIKQRGQLQPIVLDAQGRVLDGRNRLAACELAGVEPRFEMYDGADPDGYAWSVNVKRRSLTKAQVAVMAADRFADKDLSTRAQAAEAGVSQPMMVWAQSVRRYPDLHDDVLRRAKSLTDAYAVAQERDAAEAQRQAQINRLRAAAPDLLSLVDEERMSLDDAVALLDAREEKARQQEDQREREKREQEQVERERRQRHTRSFGESLVALWSFLDPDPIVFVEKTWLPDANPHRATPSARDAFTDKGLALLSERLRVLAEHAHESGGTL